MYLRKIKKKVSLNVERWSRKLVTTEAIIRAYHVRGAERFTGKKGTAYEDWAMVNGNASSH